MQFGENTIPAPGPQPGAEATHSRDSGIAPPTARHTKQYTTKSPRYAIRDGASHSRRRGSVPRYEGIAPHRTAHGQYTTGKHPSPAGAGLNSSNDLIYRVVTFLYRRIGNEKVTVNFQLITLKFPVSNNLCKNTHNFRKTQMSLSSTVHPCYSSNYKSGIISISVRPLARSVASRSVPAPQILCYRPRESLLDARGRLPGLSLAVFHQIVSQDVQKSGEA